jgi:hypothetical protein
MKNNAIDLIVQCLPPAHDAIGEYTAYFASELSRDRRVRILTSRDTFSSIIPGVSIETCFDRVGARRFAGLLKQMLATTSHAVVLQYNPFCWGRRGWAPDLVNLMLHFKRVRPDVVLGIMFHETFMMNPGLRSWVMRQYQRRQFNQLLRMADVNFFSTELWADQQRALRPQATMVHLPVGANLPESTVSQMATRRRWGIAAGDFVCGAFGGNHPSRMLPWITHAVNYIAKQNGEANRTVFLHVGGEKIDWSLEGIPVIATGRLEAAEAASAISGMDLLVNPFTDGISTRRGSAMAALQQGVPMLSTRGHATDSIWESADGMSVFLASPTCVDSWYAAADSAMRGLISNRDAMKTAAKRLYDETFSWRVLGEKLGMHLMDAHDLKVRV